MATIQVQVLKYPYFVMHVSCTTFFLYFYCNFDLVHISFGQFSNESYRFFHIKPEKSAKKVNSEFLMYNRNKAVLTRNKIENLLQIQFIYPIIDSTNQESFQMPLNRLLSRLYGTGQSNTKLGPNGVLVATNTSPLEMKLLDSLTIHAKMRYDMSFLV